MSIKRHTKLILVIAPFDISLSELGLRTSTTYIESTRRSPTKTQSGFGRHEWISRACAGAARRGVDSSSYVFRCRVVVIRALDTSRALVFQHKDILPLNFPDF